MGLEFGPGSLAGALGLLGVGITMIVPDNKWIGGLFILAALGVLFFDIRIVGWHVTAQSPLWRDRPLPLIGMFLFAAGFIACAIWFFVYSSTEKPSPKISVYEPFKTIYQQVKKLGEPIANSEISDNTSFAVYDQAIIIYLRLSNTHYVLPRDSNSRHVFASQVIEILPPDSPYFDDDFVRKRLKIRADKRPPVGGVAVEWEKNPKQWQWIGGRDWHFGINGQVRVQYFENGIVVGPLPQSFRIETGWRIFAILKDGTEWQQRPTDVGLSPPFVTHAR